MICLYCETGLPNDQPQTCSECQAEHDSRPPVVGVNHVSQLLGALDAFRAEELDREDFEAAIEVFGEMLETFEQTWRTRESTLASRLSSSLAPRFGQALSGIDKALTDGFAAYALLESLAEAPSDEGFERAESALISFFTAVCSNAAQALSEFDSLKAQAATSGALFNLPSV